MVESLNESFDVQSDLDEEERRKREYEEECAIQDAINDMYTYDDGGFCDGFTKY